MSEHINTDAIRRGHHGGASPAMVLALCDEVDRLRATVANAVDELTRADKTSHLPWLTVLATRDALRAEINQQQGKEPNT